MGTIPINDNIQTPPQIEDENTTEAPVLSEKEQREADILADIDAAMEPFDLAFKHKIQPQEAIKRSVARHYEAGHGSIQDIARVYNVSVPDVLKIVGIDDMETVETIGDLIDEDEAGPGAEMNHGKKYRVPYTLD